MSDQPAKPPRRKRYAGTHPRRFDEKYKELQPERYPGELSKVRSRGQTPAGTHIPIMVQEILEVLRPAPDDVVLDCTLGFGGHAKALAQRLGPGGRLIGVDLDAEEMTKTRDRLAAEGYPIHAHHTNFAGIGNVLVQEELDGVDVLLADLGVSSMQLDMPARGFSFKGDGPIDMRMDRSRGQTAGDWIRATSLEALIDTLKTLGDEPDAESVAAALKTAFTGPRPPTRTRHLRDLVLNAKGLDPRRYHRASAFETHPAARTFQALRMAVNRETANLEHLLRILPHVLRDGGRAAFLTFHSGEERLVHKAVHEGLVRGVFSAGSEEPLRPSPQEIHDNPRARSARLWWVRRALMGC